MLEQNWWISAVYNIGFKAIFGEEEGLKNNTFPTNDVLCSLMVLVWQLNAMVNKLNVIVTMLWLLKLLYVFPWMLKHFDCLMVKSILKSIKVLSFYALKLDTLKGIYLICLGIYIFIIYKYAMLSFLNSIFC